MKLTSENIANDPLAVARTYNRGLQTGLWKSLREAAEIFQQSGLRIFQTPLGNAVRVSAFPIVILQLFDRIQLSNSGVRALLAAAKESGISALSDRCSEIDQAKFETERELLAAIVGDAVPKDTEMLPDCQRTPFSTARLPPLLLAKTYQDGIREGKWTTYRSAGAALGRTHTDVALALQIFRLPSQVLALFDIGEVSAKIGRELISLNIACGSDALINLASEMAIDGMRRSPDDTIRTLRERGLIRPPQKRGPLHIAQEYEDGIVLGRWRSYTAAEAILGTKKDTIGIAVRISKLPREVLELFDVEQFRVFDGQKLLAIQKNLGRQQFIQNAKAVCLEKTAPRKVDVFAILAGHVRPSRAITREVSVEFRIIVKGGVSHLRITSPEINVLSRRMDEIKAWCEYLLAEELQLPKRKVAR